MLTTLHYKLQSKGNSIKAILAIKCHILIVTHFWGILINAYKLIQALNVITNINVLHGMDY